MEYAEKMYLVPQLQLKLDSWLRVQRNAGTRKRKSTLQAPSKLFHPLRASTDLFTDEYYWRAFVWRSP